MRKTFRFIILVSLIAFHWGIAADPSPAQTTPQVITMLNGNQYIGQVATVAEYGSEQVNPWNSQQIVLVNDGLRRIFFNIKSAGNRANLDDANPRANPTEFDISQREFGGSAEGFGNLRFGPFNEFGHRTIDAMTTDGLQQYIQGITRINPFWCEVKTLTTGAPKQRKFTMRIATSSVSPTVLRSLLESQIKDRNNPADFLSIVDFFRESQQYKTALEQLAFISNRFPDLSDVVTEQQTVIRQARARQWIRQVNDRISVGQPVLASDMLKVYDRSGVAGEILAEMASIQGNLDATTKQVESRKNAVLQFLRQVIDQADTFQLAAPDIDSLNRLGDEISNDLRPSNLARLDAFFNLLNDQELSDLQKSAFAISGWILGSSSANENFAVAQSFFPVRDLVREYLTSDSRERRQSILAEFEEYEGSEPRYLAPLIAAMKPPKGPPVESIRYDKPLTFQIDVDNPKQGESELTFDYHVQLPGEYDPFRRYPCVVVLPGDKDINRQLMIWCGPANPKLGIRIGQASRHGYIVVVVDWKTENQFEYGYTAREHKTVLKAVQDVLQRFSIDTDRLFLAGHGFGADAAYDIGIAHPDHWAGVVGVSGKIAKYPDLYRDHIHNRLPVYAVVGQKDLDAIRSSQDAWNRWLRSGRFFETTVVEYIGRTKEFFVEEIVEIFNWMDGYRRRLPDRNGFEITADIRRPWDNYFWFFELQGLPTDKVVWPQFFGNRYPSPVEIEVKLREGQSNRFVVRKPSNVGSGATIWLSPETVEFTQKIEVSGRGNFNDFVRPSREIMLEDVRNRGDRQHPFWANLQCVGKKWEPNQWAYGLD